MNCTARCTERKNNMEKYGEVPPKFTKAWWAYFWDYYKIHTISIGCAVILITVTTVQCVRQPKYDLNILYVNPSEVTEETQNSVTAALENGIEDITGDGKKLTFVQSLPLKNLEATDEQSYAMVTKLTLELQAGEGNMFMVNREIAEELIGSDTYRDCFMTLGELNIDESRFDTLKSSDGTAYAISLSENNVLRDSGLDTNNIYLMVRRLYEREQDKEKNRSMYENTLKACSFMVNGE